MKLLVVFVALVSFCAGNPAYQIPGDNSHYVEGESRYIWMPDGDGVPHLVDLEETLPEEEMQRTLRNGANNQYWLFTRRNPTNRQIITHGNANSIWASNYNGARPLKIVVHGWNSNGNSNINPMITSAFLAVQDCNVIVVDWNRLANSLYNVAVNGVPNVGDHLGDFVQWLINTAGGNWNQVHFVGFSLGAHIVGNAGRRIGNRAARITGLDPAGPQWGGNSRALRASDGQYVEAIHTDGGLLGIFDPIGRVNFYPNGGRNAQPGCWVSTCSHSRAYELFASTVRTNHLIGQQCANLNDARNQRCTGSGRLQLGNAIINKRGDGMFGLSTRNAWPF